MEHKVKHELGRALAKRATEAALREYAAEYAEYAPQVSWPEDYAAMVAFTVKGLSLSGAVGVEEHHISLDLQVPFVLRPFRSRAMAVIEREIGEWVARAKRGELG